MRRLLMLLVLSTSALVAGAGCTGSGGVRYTATASYNQPALAYVSPGVYVVQDYHEPVFYSDNVYWRYNNGLWYRSNYYDRGWTYYQRPPRTVMSIQRPTAYIRYRSSNRYNVNRDRSRPQGGVRVRDHRGGYYR